MLITVPKRSLSLFAELTSAGTDPIAAKSFVEKYGPQALDPTIAPPGDEELVTVNVPEKTGSRTSDWSNWLILLAILGLLVIGIVALKDRK